MIVTGNAACIPTGVKLGGGWRHGGLWGTERKTHNPLALSDLWRPLDAHSTFGTACATNLSSEIGQERPRVGSIKKAKKVGVVSPCSEAGYDSRRRNLEIFRDILFVQMGFV